MRLYKALLQRLPGYLCSLIKFMYSTYNNRSQDILKLAVFRILPELGKGQPV